MKIDDNNKRYDDGHFEYIDGRNSRWKLDFNATNSGFDITDPSNSKKITSSRVDMPNGSSYTQWNMDCIVEAVNNYNRSLLKRQNAGLPSISNPP
jgi:hypothetical protein